MAPTIVEETKRSMWSNDIALAVYWYEEKVEWYLRGVVEILSDKLRISYLKRSC